MFAVKHSKSYQVLPSPPKLELLTISIGSSEPTIYCLVYIPPNSSDEYIRKYFNFLVSLNCSAGNLVLLGDFNFNDINWDSLDGFSPLSAEFCDIIFDLNLTQLINQPTHTAGNILDLILTNTPDSIFNLLIHDNLPLPIPSDHYIITFDIAMSPVSRKTNGQINLLNFSKGDYEGLCHFLGTIDLSPCLQSEDIEFIWSYLNALIKDAIVKFVPTVPTCYNKQPTWFNSDIRHHIKCLRTLKRKLNKRPTNNNKVKYENSSNLLQAKISSAKANYESNLISAFANNNNSKIYKYIRSLTKSHSIPPTLHYNSISADSDLDKANIFNDYFYSVFTQAPTNYPTPSNISSVLSNISISEEDVYNALINLDTSKAMGPDSIPPIVLLKCASVLYKPLHHLFSLTLKYGYLPRDWKIHKIIPVFKSGDPTQVKNYRPISLLSNISKVLERIIYNKLIDHVSCQINPAQFGFMQNRSTTQQLLLFLSNAFTAHHQLDTIYLDISKAFDTICHAHLLQKLSTFNISGNLWLWFKEYLTNRFQFVSINNSYSYLLPVISGVPQGSILGPLLFILYMNDLPDAIHWSKALLFADDTKCYKHIKSSDDEQRLQHDLHNLATWSTTSHLSFNPSKSSHLSFNHRILTSYNIRGNSINTTHNHKDLGVIISDNLNWNIHHDAILGKAYRTLGLIRRTFSRTISTPAKVKLYTSLIRSQVLYCSPVWRPHLIKDIKKLEQLQRRATKYILNDYISDYKTRLTHLRLLPLMYIFEISDILFFIKNLKNPTKNFNINTYISFSTSNTRACGIKLRHNISSTNKERHFYFNRISRLWNSIPIIDLNLSISTIKSRIKSYFWEHFIANFHPDDPHKLHYLCPCGSCTPHNFPINYHHL
ncbi:MAG: reverse transcriptase family protein [Acidobacteria bacterium]|nr:reverse transcriptase family protein [Acidobacteriota bacterium]